MSSKIHHEDMLCGHINMYKAADTTRITDKVTCKMCLAQLMKRLTGKFPTGIYFDTNKIDDKVESRAIRVALHTK